MATYTIDVTQADISSGVRLQVDACAVARAMTRAIARPVCCGHWGWRFVTAWRGSRVPLPLKVVMFIRAFDAGRPVQPFQFTVDVE